MSASILRNVRLFTGGGDLTSQNNKIEFSAMVEERDMTTFGSYDSTSDSVWREVIGGIASGKVAAEGLWAAGDTGQVDDVSWTDLGGLGAWSWCPHTANVGEIVWLTKALRGSYRLGGQVGDVAPWTARAASSWPIARGKVLHPPGTARTATGSGTAVEHVAVSSVQRLYAALHVLSVSGTSSPTITVKVQSDVDNTFATPADQITFTAATARGGEILRASGPITDTWYRATWTISGTNPSFLFLVSLGVAV